MKIKKFVVGFVLGFALLVSFYFDKDIVKFFSFFRNGFLDNFFFIITLVSSEVVVFFVLTSLFLWREKKRRWLIPLWASLGITAFVSFILKITVQRNRPFQLDLVSLIPRLQEASFSTWNWSFLSFQTALGFCAIPILSEQFPKLKKFWIIFAILIGVSRIYFGLHFASDVIAGGILGYLIGIIILKLEKEKYFGERIYEKVMKK